MDEIILKRLESIEKMLTEQTMLKKEVLNFNEGALYLELSQSHLYKLTSGGIIPHYKPNGKKIYFQRQELNSWLLRNRAGSIKEVEQQAAEFKLSEGRTQI